jgi:hypothetical protein
MLGRFMGWMMLDGEIVLEWKESILVCSKPKVKK